MCMTGNGTWPKNAFLASHTMTFDVLAERPEHGQLVDAVEGLAQDVDALRFQTVEMIHSAPQFRGRKLQPVKGNILS